MARARFTFSGRGGNPFLTWHGMAVRFVGNFGNFMAAATHPGEPGTGTCETCGIIDRLIVALSGLMMGGFLVFHVTQSAGPEAIVP